MYLSFWEVVFGAQRELSRLPITVWFLWGWIGLDQIRWFGFIWWLMRVGAFGPIRVGVGFMGRGCIQLDEATFE